MVRYPRLQAVEKAGPHRRSSSTGSKRRDTSTHVVIVVRSWNGNKVMCNVLMRLDAPDRMNPIISESSSC